MSAGPFVLHGLTMALVWFLAINVAASLGVAALTRRLTRTTAVGSPAFWLALRLLPAAASIAFVGAVFVPSYWRYEPREFVEGFDSTLAALALAGLLVCAAAAMRGALACIRASTRARAWLQLSQPLAIRGVTMPAYQIDIAAPMVALVGVVSPRLFISRGVLEALTSEELAAAVSHELGHWRAADNLKRLAMRSAPDLLMGAARTVERRWASAAEHAADRRVAEVADAPAQQRARCALASALVKVARLMPSAPWAIEPISTLEDGCDIASRVHSLLNDAPVVPAHTSLRTTAAILTTAAAAVLCYTPLLRAVHALTELIVSSF